MAKHAKLVKATEVKVGDMISVRNVLRDELEFFHISHIRTGGEMVALNYATPEGQEVDYLRLHKTDSLHIIIED